MVDGPCFFTQFYFNKIGKLNYICYLNYTFLRSILSRNQSEIYSKSSNAKLHIDFLLYYLLVKYLKMDQQFIVYPENLPTPINHKYYDFKYISNSFLSFSNFIGATGKSKNWKWASFIFLREKDATNQCNFYNWIF